MILSSAEAELVQLWRSTDSQGRRNILDVARYEVEAAAEAMRAGWHVMNGGARPQENTIAPTQAPTSEHGF